MSPDVVQEWEIILILYQSVFVTKSEQFWWDISTVAYGCEVVFIRTAELFDNWIVYLRVISIVTSAQFNDKAVHSGDVSQIIYFSIAYVFLIVRFSRSDYILTIVTIVTFIECSVRKSVKHSFVVIIGTTKNVIVTDSLGFHYAYPHFYPLPTPTTSILVPRNVRVKMGLLRILFFLLIVVFIDIIESNRCLTKLEEVHPKRLVVFDGQTINLRFEVSRRITQRLVTHVTKIFLEEVLGYKDVSIIEKDDDFNIHNVYERLSDTLTYEHRRVSPDTMVNMEVWILPQEDTMPLLNKYEVKESGAIAPPGHFGWFVPEKLYNIDDTWVAFTNRESASRFDVSESTLLLVKNHTMNPSTKRYYCETSFCQNGMYVPKQCQDVNGKGDQPCALLLAGHLDITSFVKEDIDSLNLYVKVAWVGSHLRELTETLIEKYTRNNTREKSLVIVHWTPSTVIPNEKDYVSLNFPRCGTNNTQIGCEYESKRLVKVVWKGLELAAKFAYESINRIQFTSGMYKNLIERYNNYSTKSVAIAGKMAKEAINVNNSIFRDYNLTLLANDGQCKTDVVMKSFIDYIVHNFYEKLVDVLGPACSETVEPLVGVARHYKSVIISYSAEGSSFND
ncbi:hypothetical protein M0802_009574 [Mischocyttarus mexicanus]|nr:hypothetical protein M0802_009574 [Mischocyttarus mexicanus]